MFYVYAHCKPNGDPFYIGKGGARGLARAYSLAPRNNHHKNVLLKYGADNIGIFILLCESEEAAFSNEIALIAQLRAEGFTLTNMTDGGEGAKGVVHTVEMREKNAAAHRGRKHSQEAKAKMSAARKGRRPSAESNVKRSCAMRGNVNGVGVHPSLETRAKLSAAQLGNKKGVGHVISATHRKKLSRLFKGKKLSLETRAKMSVAAKIRCARVKLNSAAKGNTSCS